MPQTRISRHDSRSVHVREHSLVDELMGRVTFTEMIYLAITGRKPTAAQTRVLDAALVALMEHGLTPSVIAARLVYGSSPENLQAGVSAGLLAVGSVFVGTIEGCAEVLERLLRSEDVEAAARRIAAEYRSGKKSLPGFGHPTFKPDDPRAVKVLDIAAQEGVSGEHVRALRVLAKVVDETWGRHLTINVTGAIAATLADIGLPPRILRGAALISRAAGLVAHLAEEQVDPTMKHVWDVVDKNVPYVPAAG